MFLLPPNGRNHPLGVDKAFGQHEQNVLTRKEGQHHTGGVLAALPRLTCGNFTPLSREEERVLSVIPGEYVTDATKIRLAVGMLEDVVEKTLERLVAAGLV
jgi:hypothetical protein